MASNNRTLDAGEGLTVETAANSHEPWNGVDATGVGAGVLPPPPPPQAVIATMPRVNSHIAGLAGRRCELRSSIVPPKNQQIGGRVHGNTYRLENHSIYQSIIEGVEIDPRVRLGQTVRKRRHALGLSQEGLAEKADLHWTYIGGIERGERNVSLLNIVKIARAIGITPARLLTGIR